MSREAWRSAPVLARRDQQGIYGPENCYWRTARTEREARWGLEECELTAPFEPEDLPLDDEQRRECERMPPKERLMYLVWARMLWRASQFNDPRANGQ